MSPRLYSELLVGPAHRVGELSLLPLLQAEFRSSRNPEIPSEVFFGCLQNSRDNLQDPEYNILASFKEMGDHLLLGKTFRDRFSNAQLQYSRESVSETSYMMTVINSCKASSKYLVSTFKEYHLRARKMMTLWNSSFACL